MDDKKINPFFAVRIGASVDSLTGSMRTSVIADKPITKLLLDQDLKTSMSGNSSYVYSDKLNQGSFGIAGAYGSYSGGLSAYVGNSSANTNTATELNFNIQALMGVEYINFDELTPETLLSSLKESPKQHLLDTLEKYKKLDELFKKKKGDKDSLTAIMGDPELKAAHSDWLESVQDFMRDHGDGMVVGVMWGGIGTVSLKIKNTAEENNWKYGGRGNFSYANVGSAISIEAAYDGSQRKALNNLEVSVNGWSSGNCVSEQVNNWAKELQRLATEKIMSAKPLESAPKLSDIKDIPKIPPFQKPEKDASIASKIEGIKDLNGLEAFAMASAYDTAKKDEKNKELTLQGFIEQSKNKADVAPVVIRLSEGVRENELNVIPGPVAEK